MHGRVGIVVHGMGRSGTSTVAGMFVRAGFFAGRHSDVLPANPANPRGYHENLGIVLANERALERLGGTWFDPPSNATQRSARERETPLLREEAERMVREAGGRPIVVKDPRIDVMTPLWGPILLSYVHPVAVIRNPIETALSLQRRDGTPIPFALAAWELHMTELLNHLAGRIVTVAPYARLLEDSQLAERIVMTAASHLDPARASRIRAPGASMEVEARLHHNVAGLADDRALLTVSQRELWRRLACLPPGDQTIDLLGDMPALSSTARKIAHEETKRVRALEGERARNASLANELNAARVQAEELSVALRGAETSLADVMDSLSWRITAPLRAAKRRLASIKI